MRDKCRLGDSVWRIWRGEWKSIPSQRRASSTAVIHRRRRNPAEALHSQLVAWLWVQVEFGEKAEYSIVKFSRARCDSYKRIVAYVKEELVRPIGPVWKIVCVPAEYHWLQEHSDCILQFVRSKGMARGSFKRFGLTGCAVHALYDAVSYSFFS